MKVMQINSVYKKGSTGKIVWDIHKSLQRQGINSVVCYGRGNNVKEKNVYKTAPELLSKVNNIKSRITGMPYKGSFYSTSRLLNIIKIEKPDVIHLHCINGFFVNIYKLLYFLKKNKIPTILTLHAEFMHTGGCGHAYECMRWKIGCGQCPHLKDDIKSYFVDKTALNWNLMKDAFDGFENLMIVSVSPWLQSRAEQSPIMKQYNHSTILNGIDCNIFKLRDCTKLRNKLNLSNEKVVIYVTASFTSRVKGGNYVIELAKKLSDIKFIVIGNQNKDSIDLPDNIINIGRVENQYDLSQYYNLADICIITGKRETFSMPVAESLCCGTPVVGFKAGGPETIALQDYCEFVEFGDIEKLCEVLLANINKKISNKNISEAAIEKFSAENMTNEYIRLYKLVQKGNN